MRETALLWGRYPWELRDLPNHRLVELMGHRKEKHARERLSQSINTTVSKIMADREKDRKKRGGR